MANDNYCKKELKIGARTYFCISDKSGHRAHELYVRDEDVDIINVFQSDYAALVDAARESVNGLSAMHALIALNIKNVTKIEAEEIANAIQAKKNLAALLPPEQHAADRLAANED